MTAPTLSRERAIEIAHNNIGEAPFAALGYVKERIIAAIMAGIAEGRAAQTQTAPTLSREQAVEIARRHIHPSDTEWGIARERGDIIAAIEEALAARPEPTCDHGFANYISRQMRIPVRCGTCDAVIVAERPEPAGDDAALVAELPARPKSGSGGATGIPLGANISWIEPSARPEPTGDDALSAAAEADRRDAERYRWALANLAIAQEWFRDADRGDLTDTQLGDEIDRRIAIAAKGESNADR